jgi:hypothetical protein
VPISFFALQRIRLCQLIGIACLSTPLAKFPFIIIVLKMTDNSTQSSAWLLPLEIIELLLFDVHPKVLVSFALTCKELLDYILKNESDSVLINMWGNAYIEYINTETRYSKAQVNLNVLLNNVIFENTSISRYSQCALQK